MSRFFNEVTEVTFSVDDSKDDRYSEGFELVEDAAPAKKASTKRSASSKSEK